VYRIVPVELADDELTVAADKPLCAEYLDELRWFVPAKKIKAVTVSEEHLNLALNHYYSLESQAEFSSVAKAVFLVLDPDIVEVRLTTIGNRTGVHVTRRTASDRRDASAPTEISPNGLARLKELAGIAVERGPHQYGAISLGEGDQRVTIAVETKIDANVETLILTLRDQHAMAEGGG